MHIGGGTCWQHEATGPCCLARRLDTAGDVDLYAVGCQEGGNLVEWEALLHGRLGTKYVRVTSATLMSISATLFLRRELRGRLSEVATSTVATGIGNLLGNKGATAISLM